MPISRDRRVEKYVKRLFEQVCRGRRSLQEACRKADEMPCIRASKAHQDFIKQQCRHFNQLVKTIQNQYRLSELGLCRLEEGEKFATVVSQSHGVDSKVLKKAQVWIFCSWSPMQHLERWIFGIPLPFCTGMHSSPRSSTHPLYVRNPEEFTHLFLGFAADCDPDSGFCELYSRSEYVLKNFLSYRMETLNLPDLDVDTILATQGKDIVKVLSSRLLVECEKNSPPPPYYHELARNLIFRKSETTPIAEHLLDKAADTSFEVIADRRLHG